MLRSVTQLALSAIKAFVFIEFPLWSTLTTNRGRLTLMGRLCFELELVLEIDGNPVARLPLSQEVIDQMSAAIRYQTKGNVHSPMTPIPLGAGYMLKVEPESLTLTRKQRVEPPVNFVATNPYLEKLGEQLEEYTSLPEVRARRGHDA